MTFTQYLEELQSDVRNSAADAMVSEILTDLGQAAKADPVPFVFTVKYCTNTIVRDLVVERLKELKLDVDVYPFRDGWHIDATYRFVGK